MKNSIILSYSARPSVVLKRFNIEKSKDRIIHQTDRVKILYAAPIEVHLNADELEDSLDEMIYIFQHHDLPVLHNKEGLLSLRIRLTSDIARLLEAKGFSLNNKEQAWIFGGCHI